MKKILIILAAVILLFSGCIDQKTTSQKTVKVGDNISIDYVGSLNGSVFDTSIESIANESNLSVHNKTYKPIKFAVGKGKLIKGLEEGVIGMKIGESRTLTIPPEKGFGIRDPKLIETIPIIQNVPLVRTFPKVFEMSNKQFRIIFGPNHTIGDSFNIPDTNMNMTIMSINTTSNVLASYNLSVGSKISQSMSPWNDTVIKIDDKVITTRSEVEKNETFQFEGIPWNTTVINVDSDNMTLRHNYIPDTKMQDGSIRVHFNDTHIIADRNDVLAGNTLVYNVTIRSIN